MKFIEETLLPTVEIGRDARMNRQYWVLVVRVWRFDLIGERRFGHQRGFGLEKGARDGSGCRIEHRIGSYEAVGNGKG
jgi:hypothetical protein